MIEIIVGKFESYNKYRLDDMVGRYFTPLVIYKNGIRAFTSWVSKVMKPIIGDKILVVVYEREPLKRRDFEQEYLVLDQYTEHPYIDIVWIIEEPKGNYQELYVPCNVTHLRRTRSEDIEAYACSQFNDSSIAGVFLKAINYSWKLYTFYSPKLLNIQSTRPLTVDDINSNVEVVKTLPTHIILYKLLERGSGVPVNAKAVREYYKLVSKYSLSWVNQHMKELLEDVIDLKIKYYSKGSLKIYQMMSNDNSRNLVRLVTDIPSFRVYNLLTAFRDTDNPVESYILHGVNYINNSIGVTQLDEYLE